MSINTEIYQYAREIALEMGKISKKYFRHDDLVMKQKQDASIVTIADKEAEEKARAMINARYPNHDILGEEYTSQHNNSDYIWIIDPIDGTESFANGNPLFGNLIGVCYHGKPIIGVINIPILNELWHGYVDNQQCFCHDDIMHTNNISELSKTTLLTTSPDYIPSDQQPLFNYLATQCRKTRFGGDCVNYALVAGGWANLVIEYGLNAYDILPIVPIIKTAGGVICDHHGHELTLQQHSHQRYNVICASNSDIYEQIMKQILDYKEKIS